LSLGGKKSSVITLAAGVFCVLAWAFLLNGFLKPASIKEKC